MNGRTMRVRRATGTILAVAAVGWATGCGGSSGGTTVASSTAPGAPVVSSPAPAGTQTVSAATAVASVPAVDPTEQAVAQRFRDLRTLTLARSDLPAGCQARSDQPVVKKEVVAANIAIAKLAGFFDGSDLDGAWATLCTRDTPSSAISSIEYRFGSAASAGGFVDTTAALTETDYPGATAIERLPAEQIGEKSVFHRYRLTGARILELTWAQGALGGQVILRYAGDVEGADDPALVISLAKKQAAKVPKPTT